MCILINKYSFSVDKYRSMTSEKIREAEKSQSSAPSVKSVNPFDNLDCKYLYLIFHNLCKIK